MIMNEPKKLPSNLRLVLESVMDEYKDYSLEILQLVAKKSISANPDASASFLAGFISIVMIMTLEAKNREINDAEMITEFSLSGHNILHPKRKSERLYRDPTAIHIALHVLSRMGWGEYKSYMEDYEWEKKFCDAIYEKYKDADIDAIGSQHSTYDRNQYVKPFLKSLVAHHKEKENEKQIVA